ncbi:MAG: hypothetical protein ACON34_00760 [Flavobacteriales bacterium]
MCQSNCTDPECISYNPYAIFSATELCVCVEVPGDVTLHGAVDAEDVLLVLGLYGADTCAWPYAADSDQNGIIDVPDLLEVLGGFGTEPL